MSKEKILVVEDEEDIAEVLRFNLEREGYRTIVLDRGDRVVETVEKERPGLLVLDLMLPGTDGLEVLRQLRRSPNHASLPVVVLTAKGEEVDRIVGFELGADDYITKPFSIREVVLRIKRLLARRSEPDDPEQVLTIGKIRFDLAAHQLFVNDIEVHLTATEFRLLHHLLAGAGRVQTRDRLLDQIWGYSEGVDSRTVDTHVRRLRKKLGDEAGRVETVIGVGYRLRT